MSVKEDAMDDQRGGPELKPKSTFPMLSRDPEIVVLMASESNNSLRVSNSSRRKINTSRHPNLVDLKKSVHP